MGGYRRGVVAKQGELGKEKKNPWGKKKKKKRVYSQVREAGAQEGGRVS